MIFSANDLCTTRLCQALNCPDEAQLGWALCERHEHKRLSGKPVELHTIPQTTPTLKCCNCGHWKPDEDFTIRNREPTNRGNQSQRRGRVSECRKCGARRRRLARANLTEALLEDLRAYDRERWHQRKQTP